MTVHLRCGSYLLAPTTIDPSRTNNTASSRFRASIARVFHWVSKNYPTQRRVVQATCSMMTITGDTRSRRTRAMEQKKRDEAV